MFVETLFEEKNLESFARANKFRLRKDKDKDKDKNRECDIAGANFADAAKQMRETLTAIFLQSHIDTTSSSTFREKYW